ncbi:hypothetical protein CPB84DRAFT_1757300 [Gymnopilus junonius]|uniref:Uncharacterized protein n=1 Tax=Gymnopilus junonius TaxID=109634 RepID=A0A9P5N8H1_GYMJU|nr:hypothetical protein CPB84DRAFT_1757300 [Gymnopilus junonius]
MGEKIKRKEKRKEFGGTNPMFPANNTLAGSDMDEFYDCRAMLEELESHTEARMQLRPDFQLSNATPLLIYLHRSGNWSWCLSRWDEQSGTMEEFPLHVQGILTVEKLPPVTRNSGSDLKRYHPYMRQEVTITGLGSEIFETCYKNIQQIYMAFSNTFPEGTLDGWQHTTFSTFNAIEAGDVVELSISFAVFRTKDKRYKMIPVLKGILLLDNKARMHRQAFDDDEQVEDTERKFTKMRIATD